MDIPIADQAHMFPCQINIRIPSCSVEKGSFEGL